MDQRVVATATYGSFAIEEHIATALLDIVKDIIKSGIKPHDIF